MFVVESKVTCPKPVLGTVLRSSFFYNAKTIPLGEWMLFSCCLKQHLPPIMQITFKS